MQKQDIAAIYDWLVNQGLSGLEEPALLATFCERCVAAGLPLSRGIVFIDTLHPVWEGRAFRWRNDGVEESAVYEYGRSDQGEAEASWRRSVFYGMEQENARDLRRQLRPAADPGFPGLEKLRDDGVTDYLALRHPFSAAGTLGAMDCAYGQWMSLAPGGFSDEHVYALKRLFTPLALAVKCGALARIAATLTEVYLGRDPSQRVLGGRIRRGVPERLHAVLWFSDLRGYTTITDQAAPEEVMPLLNDYADVVITAIHEAGGDVLKLMGDGTLAIFPAEDRAQACRAALAAEADLRRRLRGLKEKRSAAGQPVTAVYLGLHVGEVIYGNIGSEERLDFTVVGTAVNEVSRIATLCRSVDRHLLISEDFAQAAPPEERATLVSVGRYALRGVGRAQDLYTLDPALL
jgi:adenylate cyclase